MCKENFGPILSLYVYDDDNMEDIEKAVQICSSTGKYALTGAVFTNSMDYLKMCYPYFNEVTGNFYINDKSTGSVVGKQPFGGSKLSGTNDKAGGEDFLKRFGNSRIIKVV
jgi:1-pyrroline-5-carboxylate dehydrogenase